MSERKESKNPTVTKDFEELIRKHESDFCKESYKLLQKLFEANPGKKMIFSKPVGYRKFTQIAPFGTFTTYEKDPDGNYVEKDTGKGAGHLMCLDHYIHGEQWCDKALEAYYAKVADWKQLLDIIRDNELNLWRISQKEHKEKDSQGECECITFTWAENDMANEHWTLSA